MPYTAPPLETISKRIRRDLAAEIPGAEPFYWPNNLYVACKVFALAVRAIYIRLSKLHLMYFVSKAVGDYLDLHATQNGTSRLPPTLAAGNVVIEGADGYTLPAGTRFTRVDGKVYQLVEDATVSGIFVIAPAVAEDVGKDYNCVPATPLPLETPDENITDVRVDDLGIKGGNDSENDASLRERLLDLKRNPPGGGKPSEYIRWVRENKVGATRVFPQRATPAAGHVTVIFMMDDAYEDGIPLPDDVDEVTTILQANAPADARLHVYAPAPVSVDIEVQDLSPDLLAVKAAIRVELAAAFRRRAEPGSATRSFTFSRSWIDEAISNASGEDSHTLSLPADDVTVGVTTDGTPELAVLGVVTFV